MKLPGEKSGDYKYICDKCKQMFRYKYNFNKHNRMHKQMLKQGYKND